MTVFHRALEQWGEDAQVVMCMEECAELIQALSKYLRSLGGLRCNPSEEAQKRVSCAMLGVMEEMADVNIMLEQMKCIAPSDEFNAIYDFKIRRLEQRLAADFMSNGGNSSPQSTPVDKSEKTLHSAR